MRYLVIDGMLHGTGIRDYYEGGYIQPELLGISFDLIVKIKKWLGEYEEEQYNDFDNLEVVEKLDRMGIEIAKSVKEELKEAKISYFSSARSEKTDIQ